ncbi:MAG: YtxH domain-containing protein [Desulfovermiculus sp.]
MNSPDYTASQAYAFPPHASAQPEQNQAHPGVHPAHHPSGTGLYPVQVQQEAGADYGLGSWFAFSNPGYMKGFLLGAGATLVLTNPRVKKAMLRGTVKLWSMVQGGVEEVKEQFQDVQAEMSQKEEPKA